MNIINNTDKLSEEIITNLTDLCINNINQLQIGYIPTEKSNCVINCLNIVRNAISINKILKNQKVKEKIKEEQTKIIENKANIDKELITSLKNIRTEIKEINLKISIGTENASLTAFVIPVISTFIAIFFSKQINKYNNKQSFLVTPVYIDQNLINIEGSGIFEIKMIHIINTICIVNKKRKGDKNERTSNRRSYDYGYE